MMGIPQGLKQTAFVRLFGLAKIPLIWFIKPTVIELDETITKIKIPYIRKNKNHLGSMYFGVLCAAADLAGGLAAMEHINKSGRKISLSFKDFHADFHKRAHGDTFFTNQQGSEIKSYIEKVIETGERQNMTVDVLATTPSQFGDEPVATFKLTLSCKLKD